MDTRPTTELQLSQEIRYRLAAASDMQRGLSVAELMAQTVKQKPDKSLNEFAAFVTTVSDTVIRNGKWYLTKPPGRCAPKPAFVSEAEPAPELPVGTLVRIDVGGNQYFAVVCTSSVFDGCLAVEICSHRPGGNLVSKRWDVHWTRSTIIRPEDISDSKVRTALTASAVHSPSPR